MDIELILTTAIILAAITGLYKILPHRNIGLNKPIISFLPKYKSKVKLPTSVTGSENPLGELEKILEKYGFKKKAQRGPLVKFTRGHILGDISIKLAKVNILVTNPVSDVTELFIEAGWVVAFDTGDFWIFLTELKDKIENT